MLLKSLELAFHFVAIGGLAFVAVLLHGGHNGKAVIQAVVVSFCILMVAGALTLARKMTNRD
jgi:hypothetical protein